jgi:hypothetical protein
VPVDMSCLLLSSALRVPISRISLVTAVGPNMMCGCCGCWLLKCIDRDIGSSAVMVRRGLVPTKVCFGLVVSSLGLSRISISNVKEALRTKETNPKRGVHMICPQRIFHSSPDSTDRRTQNTDKEGKEMTKD